MYEIKWQLIFHTPAGTSQDENILGALKDLKQYVFVLHIYIYIIGFRSNEHPRTIFSWMWMNEVETGACQL